MLYNLLVPLAAHFEPFNLFRYITFRSGCAMFTALIISFWPAKLPGAIDSMTYPAISEMIA